MGDGDDGAGEIVQESLQPGHTLGIQVVGGLVQQQHVRVRQQQAAQGHPPLLAARQGAHVGIPGRQAQCVGSDFQSVVEVVGVGGLDDVFQPGLFLGQRVEISIRFGVIGIDFLQPGQRIDRFLHAFFHVAAHVFVRIELGFLGQVADVKARLRSGFAQDVGIQPGHDAQQRRLA